MKLLVDTTTAGDHSSRRQAVCNSERPARRVVHSAAAAAHDQPDQADHPRPRPDSTTSSASNPAAPSTSSARCSWPSSPRAVLRTCRVGGLASIPSPDAVSITGRQDPRPTTHRRPPLPSSRVLVAGDRHQEGDGMEAQATHGPPADDVTPPSRSLPSGERPCPEPVPVDQLDAALLALDGRRPEVGRDKINNTNSAPARASVRPTRSGPACGWACGPHAAGEGRPRVGLVICAKTGRVPIYGPLSTCSAKQEPGRRRRSPDPVDARVQLSLKLQ